MARFEVADGWVVQAYRYALDPSPAQARSLWSHAGAARFARNHMLALVEANLEQRAAERSYGIAEDELTPGLGWSLPAMRRAWNRRKDVVAPWWAEHSKEAYNTGLDSLAWSLQAWSRSHAGQRAGASVGFPRFASRRGRASVRFTTGPIRLEASRHHATLPRLGTIRTHESTRKLARRLEAGTARILSATASRDAAGRWFVSFHVLARRRAGRPGHAGVRHRVVGVDVGVAAGSWLVAATPGGLEVARVAAPRSLAAAQARLRRLQRRAARQAGPWLHARAAHVRTDALHKATTRLAQQHQVIAIETLNAAGMRRAGGARKRGLNRALADASLAEFRRLLGYKTAWYGSTLVEAGRWYPSSKTCSACGSRKPSLLLAERTYVCEHCGLVLDRDRNAAINLARLGQTRPPDKPIPAGSSPVAGRGATRETEPAPAGDAAGDEASTPRQPPLGQPGTATPQGEAA